MAAVHVDASPGTWGLPLGCSGGWREGNRSICAGGMALAQLEQRWVRGRRWGAGIAACGDAACKWKECGAHDREGGRRRRRRSAQTCMRESLRETSFSVGSAVENGSCTTWISPAISPSPALVSQIPFGAGQVLKQPHDLLLPPSAPLLPLAFSPPLQMSSNLSQVLNHRWCVV